MATIIDGSAVAAAIKDEVKVATDRLISEKGRTPGLAFLLVGDNPASQSYVRMKGKACEYCGFHSITLVREEEISQEEVLNIIRSWNIDPEIHGILVQLPLPDHIDEAAVIMAISPSKDVDGFHPVNMGRLVIGQAGFKPCTPAGIQELLKRYKISTKGKHAVVLGRSNIVGKPIANMLVQKSDDANAVVTVVHTASPDISYHTLQADILIVAVGKAFAVTSDMVKEGAVVIDVGINRIDDASRERGYRIVGDVDYDNVKDKASFITPVPKGVGPMTIAMLMKNTLESAQRYAEDRC
jgi:methylenetetrahydrofolate dehydrogenase (NADP+) / methenyltetrahydrofolate cyclohydrolase